MPVLGLESSCDETAAAVVDRDRRIRSNVVLSQIGDHTPFGGVVPEIAARAHVEVLDGLVARALAAANATPAEIEAVAATAGPGLIGGVMVGLVTGKALAWAWQVPLIPINHLEGHALTARLTDDVAFPYLLLLVSGGHSQLLIVHGVDRYTRLGTTVDDAVGEAFDKTAKLLGLGYPGGPAVERRAQVGDPARFRLPRPLIDRRGDDPLAGHFSFSGLKTAVRRAVETLGRAPTDQDIADICAGFQAAVADVLAAKAGGALARFRQAHPDVPPVLVVAGGVAANRAVGAALAEAAARADARLVVPPPALCTDNAAMIAWAGIERLNAGAVSAEAGLAAPARARWPLDPAAEPAPGAGVKA